MNKKNFFSTSLLHWHKNENIRKMPWKGEKNPYKIWISEIILQQTRVEQGMKYYKTFLKRFPTLKKLATAKDEDVFKTWEGLGYYRRCAHLLATARHIHKDFNGKFPDKIEEIIALKGIGHYTAAAIASFAFDLPYAVVDGNVQRVLSRYFGITTPVDIPEGKKEFSLLAQKLLAKDEPAAYNQAIMDLGAVICKPSNPLCEICPVNQKCYAYVHQRTAGFPVKAKKIKIRTRYFNYLDIHWKNKIYISQRMEEDIWKNLHEFVLIESSGLLTAGSSELKKALLQIFNGNDFQIENVSKIFQQKLTHQTIIAQFIRIKITQSLTHLPKAKLLSQSAIRRLAFPKIISSYLKEIYL